MADKSNKDKKASRQTVGWKKASWQKREIRTKKHHGRQEQ